MEQKKEDCLVSCVDAGLGYENRAIIEHLDFSVHRGEYICVVGENGSGKSTLIRTLLGLLKPVSGKVELAPSLHGGAIGYLPQQTQAQKHFPASVMEVVLSGFQNQMHGKPWYRRTQKKEALRNLERLEITDLKGKCYGELSGGQQQRVAIARALALKPDILCFDEPTSALDPELTGEVLKVIRSLAQQNTTMIIVTHEMAFARDVADQVIFMDGGVIVEHGDPHEVIDHPKEERTRQFLTRYAKG